MNNQTDLANGGNAPSVSPRPLAKPRTSTPNLMRSPQFAPVPSTPTPGAADILHQMNDLAPTITELAAPAAEYFYTEAERLRAMAIYAETGSATAAQRATGIAESTVRNWVRTEEGETTLAQLRSAIRANAAWEYVQIVGLAQQKVLTRLEKGDPYITKNGEVVYLPVKARDAMVIAAMAQDKLASLAGGIGAGHGAGKALEKLANALIAKLDPAKLVEPPDAPPAPKASDYLG